MLKLKWEKVDNDKFAYDYYSDYVNVWEFDGYVQVSPFAKDFNKPLYNNYGIKETYFSISFKRMRDCIWSF